MPSNVKKPPPIRGKTLSLKTRFKFRTLSKAENRFKNSNPKDGWQQFTDYRKVDTFHRPKDVLQLVPNKKKSLGSRIRNFFGQGIRLLWNGWIQPRPFGLLMIIPPGGGGGEKNIDEQIIARILMNARLGLKKAIRKKSQTRPPGVPMSNALSTDLYFHRKTGILINPLDNFEPMSALRVRLMVDPREGTIHIPSRLQEDLIHYLNNTQLNLEEGSVIQGVLKLQGKTLGRLTGGSSEPVRGPSQPYSVGPSQRLTQPRAATEALDFLPEVRPYEPQTTPPGWWGLIAEGVRRVHQMETPALGSKATLIDYLNPGVYEGFVILNPEGAMLDVQMAKTQFGNPLKWEDHREAMKEGSPFKIYIGADGQLLSFDPIEMFTAKQSAVFNQWRKASQDEDGIPRMLHYFPYLMPMILGEGIGRLIIDLNAILMKDKRPTGNHVVRLILVDRGDYFDWAPYPKKGHTIPYLQYASFDFGFSPQGAEKKLKRGSFIYNPLEGEVPMEIKRMLNYLVDLIK